jgi:transcriptional regulator with XRE-family HTH domain
MSEENSFGRRLYAAMTARRLTVADLVRLTGLRSDDISRIVSDDLRPTDEQRAKLERAADLSSD